MLSYIWWPHFSSVTYQSSHKRAQFYTSLHVQFPHLHISKSGRSRLLFSQFQLEPAKS